MKSLRTGAALLALLFLALYARPLYSQAQTLMFGSYSGAAKAVTVTSAGAVNVSISGGAGVVPCANGGTGLSSYAVGDLLYASAACTLSKLADVAAGSYLRSGGVTTAPVWSTTTLPNSAAVGDLLYASATNVYTNLADVAAGSILVSGGLTTAPAWSAAPVLGTGLGVGTGTPDATHPFYSQTSSTSTPTFILENTNTTTGQAQFIMKSGTINAYMGASNVNSSAGFAGAGRSWLDTASIASSGWDYSAPHSTGSHRFGTGGYASGNIRTVINSTGLFLANSATSVLGWSTGIATTDTGLSRTGAGALALGNGTAGDVTGSLSLAALTVNSVVITSATTGVAGGYKIARGATAFDGANPTTVATGLTSVVSCTATMRLTAALTTGTAFVTHAAPSGANVDFYAWVIAGTASTGTETFDWVCVGT